MDLNQIAYEVALRGNRTGLANKQLYTMKNIIARKRKEYLIDYVKRQISRNVIKTLFANYFLSIIEKISKEKIHELLGKVLNIFDYVKIEPFIEHYNSFISQLEKRFNINITNLDIFVENGNRKFDILIKERKRLDYKEVSVFVEDYFEEKMKRKLKIEESFYLCSKREKPRNFTDVKFG